MRHITPAGRGTGWVPQINDHRDAAFMYAAPRAAIINPAAYVDLRQTGFLGMPFDQGQLGSCTANAIAGAIQFERKRQALPDADRIPSRLFIYYNERDMEGTVASDAGAQIRDGIKSVAQQGICFEDANNPGSLSWPYDITKFRQRPPAGCYQAALKDKVLQYHPVAIDIQQIRGCLHEGFPVVFGFTVYPGLDSQEVARTGRLQMPGPNDAPLGGHAVKWIGYDDKDRNLLVRNSWSNLWGLKGDFLMPYEYALRFASDAWTIRLVQ
jgi:C1A family cysteine protease